jgi:hypothetical protein
MSKDSKISSLKPHLSPIMDKIVISNDSEYGGVKARNASPLASIGQIAAAKAKASGSRPVGKQDWLQMGKDMYDKRNSAKKDSINAVCDTLSAYAIYVINGIINFRGKFELFKNPSPTHHHFVVVDRADRSDPNDSSTWGANCFVIDLWHAKRSHATTHRGRFETANHWKHGIFRNASEHPYSAADYEKVCEHTWTK